MQQSLQKKQNKNRKNHQDNKIKVIVRENKKIASQEIEIEKRINIDNGLIVSIEIATINKDKDMIKKVIDKSKDKNVQSMKRGQNLEKGENKKNVKDKEIIEEKIEKRIEIEKKKEIDQDKGREIIKDKKIDKDQGIKISDQKIEEVDSIHVNIYNSHRQAETYNVMAMAVVNVHHNVAVIVNSKDSNLFIIKTDDLDLIRHQKVMKAI